MAAPPRVIEAFDISNTFGTYAVASMVCAVDGLPRRNRYRRFRIKTISGIDDPRMMQEVVHRRYARLQAEQAALPDLVLVDGGLTQLRAAREALRALGLASLPSAGLAKRLGSRDHQAAPQESAGAVLRGPSDGDRLRHCVVAGCYWATG
jgi:excinuclease ABC subunit C